MTRYRCVDDRKAEGFAVADACGAAGVSPSAYYAWGQDRAQERRAQAAREERRLVTAIRRIHTSSDGTYGAPRTTRQLHRDGHRVNHKRVERLMRCHGIVGHRPRRGRSLTSPTSGPRRRRT